MEAIAIEILLRRNFGGQARSRRGTTGLAVETDTDR
jgi:hypothetical protein